MAEDVVWRAAALMQFSELSRTQPRQAKRVAQTIYEFAESGRGDIKLLHGTRERLWRLRAGDWRITLHRRPGIIDIVGVDNRSDAYD